MEENKPLKEPKLFFADMQKRADITAYITEKYPDTDVKRLGNSILGKPIDLYKIGEGKNNILFVGAHHGAEHITGSVLYSFILNLLCARANGGTHEGIDIALYLKTFTLWIVPVLNPDGVEMSINGISDNPLIDRQRKMCPSGDFSLWQANSRGVDLNHNYSAGFNEYKLIERERDIRPGRSLYSGEYPESEPETHALANLFRCVPFSLTVSLHSQGEEIYAFPKGKKKAKRLAESVSRLLGYSVSDPSDTALYGGFSDFVGESGILALTLEVGRGENPLPESEFLRIENDLNRALFLIPTLV